MARTYREDIDWLRAIAVLSVLFFHWEIAPFRGGFVGVDVFFVISGYLIVQIIQSDVGRGTFSFVHFYERRVRRLLPALYVMLALAVLPSFVFLLPSERLELFKSVAATVTFTSNIYFWLQSGYFAAAAVEKPMLHTWSLSVEEQFYLVLPLLIWTLLKWNAGTAGRRWALLLGLGLAAIASFALSVWLMKAGNTEAAFFLSPPRAWEFLVGGLMAIEGVPAPANIHLKRGLRILGIILIAVPVVGYRGGSFPGIAAIWPCLGAMLFIWSGMGDAAPARAFWSPLRIASFVGRLSYSLYLWHWPLFLYLRFAQPDLIVPAYQKLALFVLTFAVAYVSYRYVEQPFRQRRFIVRRPMVFAAAGCASVVLLLASAAGIHESEASNNIADNPLRAYAAQSYPAWYRVGSCFIYQAEKFDSNACLTPQSGKANVLLWGDSLAAQYNYGLNQRLGPGVHLLQVSGANCLVTVARTSDVDCDKLREQAVALVERTKPNAVVLAGNWETYVHKLGFDNMMATLRDVVAFLRNKNIPVVVLGPSPLFKGRLPAMLLRAQVRQIEPKSEDLLVPGLFDLDDRMKQAIHHDNSVEYVSMMDVACPKQNCKLLLANRVPLTFDHVHATADGSVLISEPVAAAIRRLAPHAGG